MGDMGNESNGQEPKLQKSYFDVLGLCCSSEVPLIENILVPLKGVQKVTVIVPSKTVIVFHDSSLISQLQIAKALNQVKLEATIRAYGTTSKVKRWPNPYILICGVLLLASFFKHFYHPLQWLAVAAAVVGLPPILFRSIASLRNYNLDINILMVIAVAGAVALRDYSEAGSIVFLFTIAEWLTSTASHKANAGMSTLMSMAPQKAILAETGQVVDAQSVQVDTVLAVKAGELIPIDGIVIEGRSEVNESSLTGESFPVSKQPESLVWAGTLNVDGYISVRTTALAENSAVAKMARLVEDAQNNRSKTQRLIDSFAKYYTPAVVIIAGGVAVIPLILKVHNPKHWFQLALILIVSACPCALVLSTPVATFNALLTAAKMGLLIKGGDVLEALAKTRVVAFDKTGTITMGEFTVMDCRSISPNIALEKLLYWISSIECKSSHPMASAVVEYARLKSVEPKPENVSQFQIYPGEGIYGEMDGKKIYVGNKRIAERAGCATVPNIEDMKDAITHGYVFSGPVPIGIFTLSDTCRTGSADAIRELKSLGIKTAMLTGDSTVAAMHAQNQLGNSIEILHSELLPEDKVRIISDLKTSEGPTVMVGDGLNDAPALAIANVGISMGISGSAVAMETSHITLMSNDIQKIPRAIRLARRTHRKIIVNMFISVITKLAIVGLAIAGHPLLWAAVLADVGTCLVVILNSMTLLRVRMANGHSHHRGSSHKSHAHKHGGHAHCAGGSHAHSCHDHEREEEERVHHNHVSLCKPHACCVGSHESLAHKPGFGESAGACGQSKCSNGMHGHTSHGHETTERQSCHDHESAGACGQSKCSSGMHGHTSHGHGTTKRHNCHDHEAGAEERAHHKCQTKCKKNSNMDSHNEHLISIKIEEECHEDVLYRAHLTAEEKEKDRCCGSERAECGSKDGCREELQEDHCHNTKCKPSQGEENKDMGGCCGTERELAERESCPWSVECTGHREIHGCGMRYRKHCEKHHSCCGNGIVQLPEIVIAD